MNDLPDDLPPNPEPEQEPLEGGVPDNEVPVEIGIQFAMPNGLVSPRISHPAVLLTPGQWDSVNTADDDFARFIEIVRQRCEEIPDVQSDAGLARYICGEIAENDDAADIIRLREYFIQLRDTHELLSPGGRLHNNANAVPAELRNLQNLQIQQNAEEFKGVPEQENMEDMDEPPPGQLPSLGRQDATQSNPDDLYDHEWNDIVRSRSRRNDGFDQYVGFLRSRLSSRGGANMSYSELASRIIANYNNPSHDDNQARGDLINRFNNQLLEYRRRVPPQPRNMFQEQQRGSAQSQYDPSDPNDRPGNRGHRGGGSPGAT